MSIKSKHVKISVVLLILITCSSFDLKSKKKLIEITNHEYYDLKDKPIVIKRREIETMGNLGFYPIITDLNNKEIPYQLNDFDGDGIWEELFFVADLSKKSKTQFNLTWQVSKSEYLVKTNVRFGRRKAATLPVESDVSDTFYPNQLPKITGFQPYQTDGPTWENDKVAFRHYLDGRNAKDLFGKRVSWMSPETVGLNDKREVVDNYHVLENWGRDVLPVGNSVGLGGIGIMYKNQLNRVGVTVNDSIHNIEKTNFKILAEGPVYSKISIQYSNWETNQGKIYQAVETPAIWPGMYAYENTIKFSGIGGTEKLVVGLPKIATESPLKVLKKGDWVILFTHDKQSYNKEFILGLAIILPLNIYEGCSEAPKNGSFSSSYYGMLKIRNNLPVKYYAVGCWELADPKFKSPSYFEAYLSSLVEQLSARISILVK